MASKGSAALLLSTCVYVCCKMEALDQLELGNGYPGPHTCCEESLCFLNHLLLEAGESDFTASSAFQQHKSCCENNRALAPALL